MKIAIIDDEIYWRQSAEQIVREYFTEKNVEIDIFESGEQYLKNQVVYDISFVDIEMPGTDGFETIRKARQYNDEGIFIILTTHTEMSRKGYIVNAFRYIDKTNLEEEIKEAIQSAELLLGRNEKISVNVIGNGIRKLVLKDITYIETEKHYIVVHTTNGSIRCNNNMTEMEEILNQEWFFRCHHAYIVNLDEIFKIDGYVIFLNDGNKIEVSQRKMSGFRKAYLNRQYKCGNA